MDNNEKIPEELEPLLGLLDQLDAQVESGGTVPFSSKKLVDPDIMHEYIDRVRGNMPVEVKRAKEMEDKKQIILDNANKEAEETVSNAKEEAKRIITEAQAEADKLVSQQEIIERANEYAKAQVQRANEEAADILEQARQKEQAIRQAMVSSINSTLSEASAVLEKSLEGVNNTKDAIARISE